MIQVIQPTRVQVIQPSNASESRANITNYVDTTIETSVETEEILQATANVRVTVQVPTDSVWITTARATEEHVVPSKEPFFGIHIQETVEAIKRLFR